MKKKWNLWHILGFHKYTRCVDYGNFGEGGVVDVVFSSPWALFGTYIHRYKCLDCGRMFRCAPGDFEMIKMREQVLEDLEKLSAPHTGKEE